MMQQPAFVFRLHRRLLSSCAMGLTLAALGHGGVASAQVSAIQGTPVVDAGFASIDNVGGTVAAPRTNIQVSTTTAVINWTPTDTAPGATPIDFLPANGLAYFSSSSTPNFTVLNRVIPATTRQIGLNGEVRSNFDISGTTSPGGNVWFYSPTGFVAGTGSRFATNGLILTANDIPYTPGVSGGGIDFGPNGEIQMTAAAGSQANITLLPGSRISNTSNDAYTLIVAPQIVQGGTIELDGSVGLIAAESVSVLIQNSLFDIDVQIGTSVANAIVHTGSTGAGPTGSTLTGAQQVVVMATPANTALTVLLGGNLGATAVNAAGADRAVILSGGYDYNGASGTGLAAAPDTTTAVDFQIGTTNFNADLTALTTGAIAGNPSRSTAINFLGNASLTAGTTVSLTADLDETITASGDLLLQAPISATIKLGTTNIEAGTIDNAAKMDVAGDLTVSSDNVGRTLGLATTGGTASISLDAGAAGPLLTVAGSTLVTAGGTGFRPLGDGAGAAGFGGTAEIVVNGGTLTLGDTTVRADGIGGDGTAGNGGDAAGGTARVLAGGGSTTVAGLTISANALGGTASPGATNGNVDSSASIARLVSAGTGTVVHADSVTLSANATGSAGDAASISAQAGTVDVHADTGGLLDIVGPLSGSANAGWNLAGSNSHSTVGATKGGSVLVTAGGGSLNTSGGSFNADATGLDSSGAQGDVTGGIITVTAFDLPGSEGSVTFTSDGLIASANGTGASGTSGGNGKGGAISLIADGGVISAGSAQVLVNASGRAAQVAGSGISGTGGSFTMVSRAGGAQAGIDFGDLTIDVSGTADYAGLGTGDGPLGQGGTVSITASGGTVTGTTILADLSGRGGNAGFAPAAASLFTGGTGQGGTFNLLIDGGAVSLTSLDVAANGTGGLAIDAGFNSFAGNPGQGIGGSATITATGGAFSVPNLSLSATGQGGAAGSGGSFGISSSAGAQGTGGGATIDIGGASFTTSTIALRADGIGGNGADGLPAGSGIGGLATVTATDAGAYSLGDLTLNANGQAGDSSGAISANDGTGTGGAARFINQGTAAAAANSHAVGNLVLQANGDGGNVGGQQGAKAVSGAVQFSDLASGANGHARYASVSAQASGLTAPAGTTALIESAGGTTAITNGLNVDSTGNVTVAVAGNSPITTGNLLSISSRGDIAITHVGQGTPLFPTLAGGDVFIDAVGNVNAGPGTSLSATGSMLVRAQTGTIIADSLAAVTSLDVHALGSVSLKNASTTGAPSGGLIYITAGVDPVELVGTYLPADIVISGLVNASGQLDVHAGRDILGSGGPALLEGQAVQLIGERDISGTQLTVRSRGDLNWLIGRNLLADTVDVAGQINMIDLTGNVVQAARLNVNGNLGIGNLVLRGPTAGFVRATGDLTIGQAQTTGLDVATPGGVLTLGGLQAYPSGPSGFLTASAPTVSLAEINVSGAINANATATTLTASNLRAGGAVALGSNTDITATNLIQGSSVTVTAPGAISLGTVNATAGNISATPGGALSLLNGTATGAITLGGTVVTIGSAQAGGLLDVSGSTGITASGLLQGTSVTVTTPGAASLGTVNATAGDINAAPGGALGLLNGTATGMITLGGTVVTIGSAQAGGALTIGSGSDITASTSLRGTSVTLTAPGTMNLGAVTATAGDISAAPGGALSLLNGIATGTITLGGSSVTLGGAQAGGLLSVNTPGAFTVNGPASGATVRASSSDVVIGTGGRIGTAGTTSLVELTNNNAARRSYYGGTGNPAGYSLNGTEMGQLQGAAITLIAPQTAQSSAAVPDVVIGDMTVTGAQLGAQGTFTVQTTGRVLINGAANFTGLGNGNSFTIRAGDLIVLDNQTGAVDLRGANNALAGRIDFSANTIIAASSTTQAALAGLSDPAAIDKLLGANDGKVSDTGVLRADSMRFAVTNGLYIQNTGAITGAGTVYAARRGFSVGSGGIAVITPAGRTTPLIVINGQAATSAGLDAFGVDTIPLVSINGQPAPSSSGSLAGSTINGCDFTNVDQCRPPLTPDVILTRDRVQNPVEEISDTPSDLAVERQSLVTPGVELQDIGRLSYEPLIDEPVTGSGNDDLWVPECDPGKGNCPAP